MAVKTGSNHISVTMAYIIKIPSAKPKAFDHSDLKECAWTIPIMTDNRKWPPKPPKISPVSK